MVVGIYGLRTFAGTAADPGTMINAPEVCPLCRHAIDPKQQMSYVVLNSPIAGPEPFKTLEVIFSCPRSICQRLFVARYSPAKRISLQDYWSLIEVVPRAPITRVFESLIVTLSPSFTEIYAQAEQAEQLGLLLICGPGYRKSLEFLIKDYAKGAGLGEGKKIEGIALAACIELIGDERIKAAAKRATWLGNDETHYLRKWEQKDVSDLKKLIELTLYWISSETMTKELSESMPDPKAK